jgi:AbrB family looped-hinge helix DNA binding protein
MEQTHVDQNGRVLVPARVRRALGLRRGSALDVSVDDRGRIVLERPRSAWERARGLVAEADPVNHAASGSVVDELLAERRAEARRERS